MPDVRTPLPASTTSTPRRQQLFDRAFQLSLAAPVFFAVAALGTRLGLWSWQIGLGVLTLKVGPLLVGLTLLLAVVALGAGLLRRPKFTPAKGWIALAIPLMLITWGNSLRETAARLPPIHDINTSITSPVSFSARQIAARGPEANPVTADDARVPAGPLKSAWSGRLVRDAQRAAYPDILPINLNSLPPDRAHRAAAAALQAMGLQITASNATAGRIEAVATSFWFGFKDDVAVRIAASPEGGTLIDLRSASRVGQSDLGQNAARIRGFKAALDHQMSLR